MINLDGYADWLGRSIGAAALQTARSNACHSKMNDFKVSTTERCSVDGNQQHSREDLRHPHVQVAVHALTTSLRSELLARSDVAWHRLSSSWKSLSRQAQKYLVCNVTSLTTTSPFCLFPESSLYSAWTTTVLMLHSLSYSSGVS